MIRVRPIGPLPTIPVRRALRPLRSILAAVPSLLPPLLLAATWVTHVVACATGGLWGLFLLGLLLYPVAVVHGLAVWLGALL